MTHEEKRSYLIKSLLAEQPRYKNIDIPQDEQGQKDLLRSLMNVRKAKAAGEEFLRVQDEYLQEAIREKGITRLSDLTPVEPGIYLWQGDITTLACDAIVNAANSGMTGCYQPCHNCIDNCIHTYAGVELRADCARLMEKQGHPEPTGSAKITPAFNLPSKYVLHTVGPIVQKDPTAKQEEELSSSYRACLALAQENGCKSLAFCCISTGVFGFPQVRAAKIAVKTVRDYQTKNNASPEVIFNVFTDTDREIYQKLLG